MRTTENLSLEIHDNREDGSVETGTVANSNASNFEKIDKFAEDVGTALGNLKDNIKTIHGLHTTKTDEVVTVDDADAGGIFKKIATYGAYEQLSTTGKNVLGISGTYDTEQSGVTVSVVDDIITLNGTVSSDVEPVKIVLGNNCKFAWDSGKRYTLSVVPVSGSATLGTDEGNTFAFLLASPNAEKTFDVDTTQTNIASYTKVGTSFAYNTGTVALQIWRNGTVFNDFKFRLQVELGTRFTSYEPFSGGKPSPSLDYPQDPKMLKEFSMKISGADTSKTSRILSFNLPEDQPYLAMLPDTTKDVLEISADGSVNLIKKIWHKRLKIADMDNAENYPGWSLPKSDELMSYVKESSHSLVSSINSFGIQFTVNTVGDTIRLFATKEDFGGLTQPELVQKYPNTYMDIYGKIETEEAVIPVTNIDPVLVPESTSNIWVDGEMQTDVIVDYPRDINIIISKIEEKLASIT